MARESRPDSSPSNGRRHSESALRTLGILVAAGLGITVGFSLRYSADGIWVTSLTFGLATAGAALFAGGLLGFVFAIPRTLQEDPKQAGSATTDNQSNVWYQANTNLEQISDWLTKIIIGVGLVELNELPGKLRQAAGYAGPGFVPGDPELGERFAAFLLVFFLIAGFLVVYLWTRLYLAGALRSADQELILAKVDQKIEELRSREELDAHALTVTQRQLEQNEDEPSIPQATLDKAVADASIPCRSTIFREAERLRRATWKRDEDKLTMERTIPIFRALIAADPTYHRDHANLGYALKDQRDPDYLAAKEELDEAIRIREVRKVEGYFAYEMNRAQCEIALEKLSRPEQPSLPEVKVVIFNDLMVACRDRELRAKVEKDELFIGWMRRNRIDRIEPHGSG